MEEIDRLRAVVAKLTGTDNDAHSTLRRMYLDEAQNPNTRVRAAQAALGVEKASLKPVTQLELTAEPEPMPLAELVRLRRARSDRMYQERLASPEATPEEKAVIRAAISRRHGNGQDGDGSSND
jgi:hypothetical protein